MADRTIVKPEIASQKRTIKLPPALGDWTTYRPARVLVKKVKTGLYGFDRLSHDELDRLLQIHYRFVLDLLSSLKIDLGLGIEFISCQAEQTTYLNFLRGLNFPATQGKVALDGFHETVQFFCDCGLSHSLINHALGSHDLEQLNRGLTDTEKEILAAALNEYLPLLNAAYAQVLAEPAYSIVSSPDVTFDPAVNTTATFVSFTAEVALRDLPPGRIILAYPGGLARALLRQYEERTAAQPLNFARLPLATLTQIMIGLKAQLGRTKLNTTQLHSLEVGDVISLDTAINSAIGLTIGGRLQVPAQPGIFGKKRGVRIAGFSANEESPIAPPIVTKEEKPPKQAPAATSVPAPAPTPAPAAEPLAEEEEEFKAEDLFPEDSELGGDEKFEDIFEDETKEA